jgi:hypothetical protein
LEQGRGSRSRVEAVGAGWRQLEQGGSGRSRVEVVRAGWRWSEQSRGGQSRVEEYCMYQRVKDQHNTLDSMMIIVVQVYI